MLQSLLRMRQACIRLQAIEPASSLPWFAAIAKVPSSTATRLYLHMHPACCNENLLSLRPAWNAVRQFGVKRSRKKIAEVQRQLDIEKRVNEGIEAEQVLLVGEGVKCVISLQDAIQMAKQQRMQLVEVDRKGSMPTCRIMVYSEYIEKAKIMQEAKFKARKEVIEASVKIKGLRIGCDILLLVLTPNPPGSWAIMVILKP
jgi:hypothetical protein